MIINIPFFVLVQETDVTFILFNALLACGETLFCSSFPYCDGAPVWFEHWYRSKVWKWKLQVHICKRRSTRGSTPWTTTWGILLYLCCNLANFKLLIVYLIERKVCPYSFEQAGLDHGLVGSLQSKCCHVNWSAITPHLPVLIFFCKGDVHFTVIHSCSHCLWSKEES
jgi:hypothetical protein